MMPLRTWPVIIIIIISLWPWLAESFPMNQTIVESSSSWSLSPTPEQQLLPENGTTIIMAGGTPSEDSNHNQDPLQSQFNVRRRDMFFEDYSVKQIQVVDTVAISNNSINNNGDRKSSGGSQRSTVKKSANESFSLDLTRPSDILQVDLLDHPNSNENDQQQQQQQSPLPAPPPPMSKNFTTPEDPALVAANVFLQLQPQRPNILLPKLEQSGKPACLQTPDDTYCEAVENYPKAIIKEEMDFSVEQFSEIFGSKEIDGRTIMDLESDGTVCRITPRVIYPKLAKNHVNQWIYVVNDVEYTQAVVAEICERPGKPCAYMDNLPIGMYSRCKQKYSYKRLVAMHPTERRTYADAFRFPSCCSCYIKTVDDFMARSNLRKIDKPVSVVGETTDDQTQPREPPSSPASSSSSSSASLLMSSSSSDSSIRNGFENTDSITTTTTTTTTTIPTMATTSATTTILID